MKACVLAALIAFELNRNEMAVAAYKIKLAKNNTSNRLLNSFTAYFNTIHNNAITKKITSMGKKGFRVILFSVENFESAKLTDNLLKLCENLPIMKLKHNSITKEEWSVATMFNSIHLLIPKNIRSK
jgi:hypothetical protein